MSYQIYPVTETELKCNDYRVTVNGKEAPLNTARVSAVPFNRRWPGHQRQIEQSEPIQFLSLATNESLTLEITPNAPFESVTIRPQSLGIVSKIENGTIKITLEKPAYFTVEPYGRNRALHVFADPMPDYGVDIHSPDVIYFGAGEHDVGNIELKSGQTLFLDEGAVVYACIHAIDAQNIKIIGRGILDNSRNKEQLLYEANVENNDEAVNNAKRAFTVELEYCTNVLIDGITVRDSLVYNIRPIGCENIRIKNVKIIGCWRYNSDGIDMHNCVDVHISDCFLRTYDDSICVKGFDCYYDGDVEAAVHAAMYRDGKAYDVFKNVLVERCVIWNDWGKCLEIGAETKAEEICNITFQNCDLIHLTGSALDCMNVDYADVHDVIFRNINIECDEEIPAPSIQNSDGETYQRREPDYMPNTIDLSVIHHHEYSRGSGDRRGKNRDILFQNIHVLGDKLPKVQCFGYDETHKTENVLISNLTLNGKVLDSLPASHWRMGDFAENIRIAPDPYAQMAKNSVSSANQLKETHLVKFDSPYGSGKRIMFVGNSITLHGVLDEIGWHHAHGMAASEKEKDYVHLTEAAVRKQDPSAAFCICQVANWERQYQEGEKTFSLYESAQSFGADIIVIRCIENCPSAGFDGDVFEAQLDKLIRYLDKAQKAKIIITTGFWAHPGDDALRKYASKNGLPCVELGDLGEQDEMKALGLFAHEGVANHPGDLGMKNIAERITKTILTYLA
jgi:hypothetical protein